MTTIDLTADGAMIAAPDTVSSANFWNVGHRATLIAAFLYFDVAFMVWVLLGPLAPIISRELISARRRRA